MADHGRLSLLLLLLLSSRSKFFFFFCFLFTSKKKDWNEKQEPGTCLLGAKGSTLGSKEVHYH